MKNQRLLNDYIKVADMHALKLKGALDEAISMQSSLTPALLPKLSLAQAALSMVKAWRYFTIYKWRQ